MDEIKLDALLTRLGFERTAGRKYIHEAMMMIEPGEPIGITEIYRIIGERHLVSPNVVSNAIRRAIEQAYTHPVTVWMGRYFHPSTLPARPPKNKMFLRRLGMTMELVEGEKKINDKITDR